jgi:UDP-2,3-diacylglucosamine pyrophosphatase LpxH
MRYDDSVVTLSSGFIGRSQTVIPYSGIKSAHTSEEILKFMDNYLGIATVVIHGDQTISVPGVKNAIQIVKEIGDRVASKKEKKADPMELVMKELTALKTEVTDLRKKIEEKERKERTSKEEEKPKKKFALRPFEEAL